jgi:ketosteroid isomerase-like protein
VGSAWNRLSIADLYGTWIDNDEPTPVLAAFDDRSVWIEPGDNARSGVFRGRSAIRAHAIRCKELADGTTGTDVLEILSGERFVVVIERSLALRNGAALNMLVHTVYEIQDGVITEIRTLPYDPEAWNEFWA